jgi:predicted Zn finger-like uncharacterized protein
MQIVCPNCSTSYELAAEALGADGRSVRCARCREVWFAAAAAEPVMTPALASADDPGGAAMPDETGEIAPASVVEWSAAPDAADDAAHADAAPASHPRDLDPPDEAARREREAAWAGDGAVPVVLAPALVPAIGADPLPHVVPENIETIAARRASQPKKPGRLKLKLPRPGLPAAIVAFAALLAGLFVWRGEVVRFAPQTAALFRAVGLPVNLRGLVFENVRTTGEVHEGVPVLIVEGTIANVAGRTVEVPRLRFAMRNAAGHEIYAWTTVTGRSILSAGETAAFRTRLASPPADGRDVIVRFFNRRDLLAGMR